jgi:hypothetical protein
MLVAAWGCAPNVPGLSGFALLRSPPAGPLRALHSPHARTGSHSIARHRQASLSRSTRPWRAAVVARFAQMIDLAALRTQLKLLGHNLPDEQVMAILKDMNIDFDAGPDPDAQQPGTEDLEPGAF